jgi:hypothetical protein
MSEQSEAQGNLTESAGKAVDAMMELKMTLLHAAEMARLGYRHEELINLAPEDDESSLRDLRNAIMSDGKAPEMIDVGNKPYDWSDRDAWEIAAINDVFRD